MNLLIVDDEPSILIALKSTIKNHTVFTSTDPNEIKNLIEINKIDILVVDFDFGPTKITNFVNDFIGIPTIIMTGKATRIDIFELVDLGFRNFI